MNIIWKRKKQNVSDEDLLDNFTELGMPKNLAKTLIYLSKFDECRPTYVKRGPDLRQPEVITAMEELRKCGWVKNKVKDCDIENEYNVFVYDTIKYPPNSTPTDDRCY